MVSLVHLKVREGVSFQNELISENRVPWTDLRTCIKHNNSPVFSHLPILQLNCTVTIDLLIPLENTQRLQLIFSWQIYRRWLYNFLSKCLAISCNQKKDWRHQQNLRMLYKGTHFKRSGDFTKSFQFTEISIQRKAVKTTTKHVWCEWYITLWQDKNTSCFHFII